MQENKIIKNYKIIDKLVEEPIGKIFKAEEVKTNELVILKMINKNKLQEKEYSEYLSGEFYKEIQYLKEIKECSNIVRMKEEFFFEGEQIVIYEFCDSNLAIYMENYPKGLSLDEIRYILCELSNAFAVLNVKKIIYRDIKPENILFKYTFNQNSKYNYIPKIKDLGISLKFKEKETNTDNSLNPYIPPEALENNEKKCYTKNSDLWSLGILIHYMYFGIVPNETKEKDKEETKNTDEDDLCDLINLLLVNNPEKRIDWIQFFVHSFLFNDSNSKKIKLIYEDNEKSKIKLFGGIPRDREGNKSDIYKEKNDYVEANKSKCVLIINGQRNELCYEYDFGEKGKHEIYLIERNGIINRSWMFSGVNKLLPESELNKLDTLNTKDLSYFFYFCKEIKTVPDISNWCIDNTKDISHFFSGCYDITVLPDISKWKTNEVTDLSSLFFACFRLTELPDIYKWNTNKVNNTKDIFFGLYSLKKLPENLDKFNKKFKTDL